MNDHLSPATTLDASPSHRDLGPVVLVLGTPGSPPTSVTLDPGQELSIGRGGAVDLRLDDGSVSACHARLVHDGRSVRVTDLGSRNGVRIGGARVAFAALEIGEVIGLGRATVTLLEAGQADDEMGDALAGMIGGSTPMRRLAVEVRRVAPLRLPALIRGETGTGKDLVARAIHAASPRSRAPFVAINAAAIGRELAESELFGHERGAFTGAMRDRRGAFREAHGGTLFVDEIGALAPEVQAKLLRVVEDGVVRPLGGESRRAVDVRLVAATCEPLESMVAARAFRADLLERLAACVIVVPPLRDRREDISLLARHLLAESGLPAARLAPSALALLRREPWPGNVRELRNIVVQSALRAGPAPIEAWHVAQVLSIRANLKPRPTASEARRLLDAAHGNISEAARRAMLPRSTLRDLLRVAERSR